MTDQTTKPSSTKQRVSKYWRSLDQLEGSTEFQEFLHREFPKAASELPEGVSRRRWLQLMGASFTLAAAQGCRWQTEKFAAFADRPEGYVPGSHTKFATSVELAGAPRHLVVTCYDGRPIKVDGNPDHPGCRGGSDAYSQALTLSLYDPDRKGALNPSGQLRERDGRQSFQREWADFELFARETLERLAPQSGAGLAILMQPTDSLSVNAALKRLVDQLPKTALFEYSPLSRDNELAGSEMAFGKRVRTHHKLAGADVIACFDADLLSGAPGSTLAAGEYAERREPNAEKNPAGMNRLYVAESQFSVTGAAADHRLAIKSSSLPAMLAEVRDRIQSGEEPARTGLEEYQALFVEALVDDLVTAKGKSVVVVGARQSPEAHAIAHEINALLGNVGETVIYTDEPPAVAEAGSLADLLGEIAALRVDTLLILGGNPVYDSPADFNVAEYIRKTPHSIHLSEYENETSRECQWSLPEAHPLESWGDAPGWDGAVSVRQPVIEPLLGGRSALEVLALMSDGPEVEAKQLVRGAVTEWVGSLDDAAWRKLLHDGFLPVAAPPADSALVRTGFEPPAATDDDAIELVFTPSSQVYDGRFANNGWLQETPDFITKLTWDNAAIVSEATAAELGAEQGELIRIITDDGETRRELELPVFIQPGQAERSIGVALGYGRTAAGRVGGMVYPDGSKATSYFATDLRGNWGVNAPVIGPWIAPKADPVGADAYVLRTSSSMDTLSGFEVKPTGKPYLLATTQDHHAIDELGLEETERRSGELIREATVDTYNEEPEFAKHVGAHVPKVELWNELTHDDGRAWGMAIDLNKCIGCNACSVACQAENNVPVVGKDQVARGREMHWIRIDRYMTGDRQPATEAGKTGLGPRIAHQPLTCQHCETAPCEQVCPVAATVHSEEGLNDMVYNRCVGTRYCANNCPFKVRRFNFFHYTDRFDKANNELMRLVMNPEVTVRSRGVMEKCTYCTQRISKARIEANNEDRPVRDGDVVTACQEACSTKAIVFGDLNDKDSEVRKWHDNERSYTLLDGLRLKPRTKYLARVLNPHKLLEPFLDLPTEVSHHGGHHGEHGDGEHHDGHEEHGGSGRHDEHDDGPAEDATEARRQPFAYGQLPIIA